MSSNNQLSQRIFSIALALLLVVACGSWADAASLTWDTDSVSGVPTGGTGNWSTTDLNWDNAGVFQGWVNDDTATGDDASLGGIGGTVTLTENIAAKSITFVNGPYTVNMGSFDLLTELPQLTVPSGVTINMNGGALGRPVNSTTSGGSDYVIQSGGKISGLGSINGRADLIIEDGGTLEVGNGELRAGFGFGDALRWRGAIQGNGTTSVLSLGRGDPSGQLKGLEDMSGNPNASISGIVEMRVDMVGHVSNLGFGRFVDPDLIDIDEMKFNMYGPVVSNPANVSMIWEAQTTLDDVFNIGGGGELKLDPAFKLGEFEIQELTTLRLADTGSVDDDFVYFGDLTGFTAARTLDLFDVPILTDESEAFLDSLVSASAIINTGTEGIVTVKEVMYTGFLTGGTGMFYLAPANITLPDVFTAVPEPSSLTLLGLGAALLVRRRRNHRKRG